VTLLLRKLTNRDAWAEAAESKLWESDDCPPEILSQVFDKRGVSMWRVAGDDEVNRFSAAQALMQSSIGVEFNICLIEESSIVDAGIKLTKSPAKTLDKHANDCHVDVLGLTGKNLIKLAKIMVSHGAIRTLKKLDLLQEAKLRIADGSFDRSVLVTKGNRNEVEFQQTRELVFKLWKDGDINLV